MQRIRLRFRISFGMQDFLRPGHSGPAADHADIGILFFQKIPEAFHVVAMAARQDHKIGIGISLYFLQSLRKGITDDTVRTCRSGMIGKQRTVFQDRHFKSGHFRNPDDRNRYMSSAADRHLFLRTEQLRKNLPAADFKDARAFC